jgi:hypothetical protein
MTKNISGILLLLSIVLFACKKTDTAQPKITHEKIIGKWKIISIVRNDFFGGTSHISTINGNQADYADFRSNNKVNMSFQGSYDLLDYGILSDTKMWIGSSSDTLDIIELTGTSF